MKFLLFICCIAFRFVLPAQNFALQFGRSLMPADHIALRYEHPTNSEINFAAGGFYESSHAHQLNYSCFGADLLAEYVRCRGEDPLPWFQFRTGIGATWQIENEPWLFKELPFSKRMNYGLLCEASLDCNLTEVFRVCLFGQQKFVLSKLHGKTAFCFGAGIAIRIKKF